MVIKFKTQRKKLMSDLINVMTSYLVFERKDVTFQVPDDFPEDQIPKFLTHKEFLIWYKGQNFSNLQYENINGDDEKNVIEFKENGYTGFTPNDFEAYKSRISSVKRFFKNIKENKHLLEGFFNEKMFSLNPIDFLEDLSKLNLPVSAFQQLKIKLLKKYPTKLLNQILKSHLNVRLLNSASEQFVEMLFEEKINLQQVNFFSLDFN